MISEKSPFMQIRNFPIASVRWVGWVRFFHWSSAFFLVLTWLMIALHDWTDDENDVFFSLHKAFGVFFFVWVILRLYTRFATRKKTPVPVEMSKLQTLLSHLVHLALYVCMLGMPITGFFNQQFESHDVSFGLFHIPVFVTPNEDTAELLETIHTDIFWVALLALLLAHILAAIHHQWIKKDRLINRML